MTKLRKLYASIVKNPKDVDFEDLDRILRQYGFIRRQPGKGSSHYTYHHPGLVDILTVPYNRPVKAIYVRQAIAAIERLREGSDQE
ncbi:MAG: hypothetical protein ACOYU7_10380 [Bacillota bacterium]